MPLLDQDSPYIYIVEAELHPSADADGWNEWYDSKHVPELLTVPGFLSAARYQDRADPRRYLAAYRLATRDPFSEQRYAEVTGWGAWGEQVRSWNRGLFERRDFPDHRRGS